MEHRDIPPGEMHPPQNWTFADATEREAETIDDEDLINRWALQEDDGSLWALIAVSPATWRRLGGGGSSAPGIVPVVTYSDNNADETASPDDIGKMLRFTGEDFKVLRFDASDGWEEGQIIQVTNRAAWGDLELVEEGVALSVPKGGTLVLEPGDTVSVHFVAADQADVSGSTYKPEDGEFQVATSAALDATDHGWEDASTLRVAIDASELMGAHRFYISVLGPESGTSHIVSAYIGAKTGDYGFLGEPSQIAFTDFNPSPSVGADELYHSNEVDLDMEGADGIVISFNLNESSSLRHGSVSGWVSYKKAGWDAHTESPSGYSAQSSDAYLVFEVYAIPV